MSEAEFDSYLSLLSKFLRLRARHRGDLADELRDHLDSRLEELLAAGKTREEAVAVALEEFGDAAVLATEFSRLASRRTRRFVMRCTAASAAVVAAVILISVALAPPGPNGPGPEFIAAQPGAEGGDAVTGLPGGVPATPDKSSIEQAAIAALDEKLGKPVTADFGGPLRTALEQIADSIDADLLIDEPGLTDEAVNVDDPVTLKLTRTSVSARTVFEFLLEPHDLALVNRAGVIYVTTRDKADELLVTRVYNVRDLLENAQSHSAMQGGYGGMGGGLGGGGFFSVADRAAATALVGQIGGDGTTSDAAAMGMMGGGGMGGMAVPGPHQLTGPAGELVEAIRGVTPGPWVETDGTGGTITVFNGLLVVRQTEENHAELLKLLEALREAGRQRPGGTATVPQGEAIPGMPGTAAAEAASDDRPNRETFERRLAQYPLTDAARELVLDGFRRSGGARTLDRLWILRNVAQLGRDAGLVEALRSLNVEPRDLAQAAAEYSYTVAAFGSPFRPLDLARDDAPAGGPIDVRHVLLGILAENHPVIREFSDSMGLTPEELHERLRATESKATPPGDPDGAPTGLNPGAAMNDKAPPQPMTRDDLTRLLSGFDAESGVFNAFHNEYNGSGGRRSLRQVRLFANLVEQGGVPVNTALIALNLGPKTVLDAAWTFPSPGAVASPQELVDRARGEAKRLGDPAVQVRHVLLALLSGDYPAVDDFVKTLDVTPEELRKQLRATGSETAPTQPYPASIEATLRSNVRIRVKTPQGTETGSGTVIGPARSQQSEALVLTCGHIFRDLGENTTVEVSLFPEGPAGPSETLTGRLIASDREADLGLIAISAGRPLPAVPVADSEESVRRGDEVFSVGCSNGEPPTAERHTVTRLDPYTGPSSIECTGMPTLGRSGGGLFSSTGKLIGVCFAAARQDETGVYVGLKEIHELLRKTAGGDDSAGAEPKGEGPAAFYEPSGEEVNWPELGLQMTAVKNPQWFAGSERIHKWAQIGLLVTRAPDRHLEGLKVGDVIVSYSANKWTRNPQDSELMAFAGQEIPSPERITRQVALAHGATSIVFQVIRVENGLPRVTGVHMPIAEAGDEGVAPAN